jgi:hypothetical protein
MKYLLTIYGDESGMESVTEEQVAGVMAAYEAFGQEAAAAGVLLGGEGLQPTSTATTVRQRGGERIVTDGPFIETKEALGGYYLLDLKDLDEAIDWAGRIPAVQFGGAIEVRPVMDYEVQQGVDYSQREGHTA